jgi:hypothetical protein
MSTPTATTAPAGRRAAVDLAAIREQWGDLLAAIERPPTATWPPRESRGFLDHAAADDRTPTAPIIGRTPLTLREHPAPLNLDALDAALEVERDMFDLADQIAERAQRPARDQDDRADLARWHYQTATSPGSRAYGLHWAAVWIEGRVVGDGLDGDLFAPLSPRLLDHAAAVAARARRTLERALARDGRTTHLDTPCPWCRGQLVGHTRSGGEPVVTCSTGEGCGAPATLDRGRRVWRGAELVGLWSAMDAARAREE